MLPIFAVIPALSAPIFGALAVLFIVLGLSLTAWNFSRANRAVAVGATSESVTTEDASAAWTPLIFALIGVAILFAWTRGSIKLHSYGLLLIVGFLLATWSAMREAKRRGYDPNLILDLALPMLLVCIAACRILYVILNRDQFSSVAQMFRIWDGGLSFHGALVGAIAVVAFYGWRSGIGFWNLADMIAPSVFLGYAFGRVGCLLNGCCYGAPCDLPWAMVFPVEGGPIGSFTLPSHPAQIYSSLLALGLFGFMQRAKLQPRFNRFAGQLTLLFFALYAGERFIIEIFRRGATARTVLGTNWLTEAQLMSLLGLIFIAAFWIVRSRTAKPNAHQETGSHNSTSDAPALPTH